MTTKGTSLTPADYAALQNTWIDQDLADAAMLRRVDHFEGSDILGCNGRGGRYEGLCIPYCWPGENRVREYRMRRDHPEYENGEPKGKYMAPPGRASLLYFGPHVNVGWLADVQLPIVLTEGDFKCLALHRASYHGLGDGAERPRFLPVALPAYGTGGGGSAKSWTKAALASTRANPGPIPPGVVRPVRDHRF
jgi:hypothetical protein